MNSRSFHCVAPAFSRWLGATALLSALAGAPVALADELFYKYDNAEGVTVIGPVNWLIATLGVALPHVSLRRACGEVLAECHRWFCRSGAIVCVDGCGR